MGEECPEPWGPSEKHDEHRAEAEDSEEAEATPLLGTLVVMGDLNIQAESAQVNHGSPPAGNLAPAPGVFRDRRSRIWNRPTEVSDGPPPHHTAATGIAANIRRVASLGLVQGRDARFHFGRFSGVISEWVDGSLGGGSPDIIALHGPGV